MCISIRPYRNSVAELTYRSVTTSRTELISDWFKCQMTWIVCYSAHLNTHHHKDQAANKTTPVNDQSGFGSRPYISQQGIKTSKTSRIWQNHKNRREHPPNVTTSRRREQLNMEPPPGFNQTRKTPGWQLAPRLWFSCQKLLPSELGISPPPSGFLSYLGCFNRILILMQILKVTYSYAEQVSCECWISSLHIWPQL